MARDDALNSYSTSQTIWCNTNIFRTCSFVLIFYARVTHLLHGEHERDRQDEQEPQLDEELAGQSV